MKYREGAGGIKDQGRGGALGNVKTNECMYVNEVRNLPTLVYPYIYRADKRAKGKRLRRAGCLSTYQPLTVHILATLCGGKVIGHTKVSAGTTTPGDTISPKAPSQRCCGGWGVMAALVYVKMSLCISR